MPAQKRSMPENLIDDDDEDPTTLHNQKAKQSRPQDDEHRLELPQQHEDEVEDDDRDEEEADDSEDSPSSTTQEKPEFLFVQLSEIRKDVHCPICLGIIKKTRTVMECLHRFCRECIDKSMRMGNNECPACRTHCASRRSLRDDPNYDAVIASLYPDIEKYEEEELAFHEEERTRNEQIQASIAQIFQRQSEALIKRRSLGKDTQDAFITRSQRNSRTGLPRRRSSRATELQGSEDNENENGNNNVGTQSPSTDERRTEVRPRRPRRQAGLQSSQPSSVINSNGACTENDLEVNQEIKRISPGLVWSSEMLAWGRGGARSHTRNGIASSCNNKISRRTRISKLVNYLRSLEETNDELDVHLTLISLDKRCTPSLQQPHLCCRPNLSVKHLCEYVAHQTPLQAEEVELFSVKGYHSCSDEKSTLNPSDLMNDLDSVPHPIDPSRYDLQILREEETMAGIKANCTSNKDFLILAYRRKEILLGI